MATTIGLPFEGSGLKRNQFRFIFVGVLFLGDDERTLLFLQQGDVSVPEGGLSIEHSLLRVYPLD